MSSIKKPLKESVIAVLCGGASGEADVSRRSGRNVCDALKRLGYEAFEIDPYSESLLDADFDIAFNILHGRFGEDGVIQSYLDHHGIPYVGSGVQASVMAMNKFLSKLLFIENGISTPAYQLYVDKRRIELPESFGFPMFAKPVDEGSSLGVHIIDTEAEFFDTIRDVLSHFGTCLVEEYIDGKDLSVGVLDQESGPFALPVLEMRAKNRFYDYDAKYTAGKTDLIVPAEIDAEATRVAQELAVRSHVLMGCKGFSRTDMVYSPDRGVMVLEVNTLPGLTDTSDLPAEAAAIGMSFDQLIEAILRTCLL